MNSDVAILVGFDRTGSSMIAKVLGMHPAINLIFQPFNSTIITKSQWEIWPEDYKEPETEVFLKQLLEGKIYKEYIRSDWFYNHSTSHDFEPGQLNLIKDTKLQFKIPWLQANFPEIKLFGIWRDPRAVLCSLVRNDFHKAWYGDIDKELIQAMIKSSELLSDYEQLVPADPDEVELMALAIALRTHFMVKTISPGNWVVYEQIMKDPDQCLNEFTSKFGLDRFEFSEWINTDYNIIGKPFQERDLWKTFFPENVLNSINNIFAPLFSIYQD